ncbi:hypothetical protein ACFE04_000019 [Oxalis oulophora]
MSNRICCTENIHLDCDFCTVVRKNHVVTGAMKAILLMPNYWTFSSVGKTFLLRVCSNLRGWGVDFHRFGEGSLKTFLGLYYFLLMPVARRFRNGCRTFEGFSSRHSRRKKFYARSVGVSIHFCGHVSTTIHAQNSGYDEREFGMRDTMDGRTAFTIRDPAN